MTDFTKDLLAKDESPESIVLMLETEWPQMVDRVGLFRWVEFLGMARSIREVEMESNQENTAELGYDLYKKYKQRKADEIIQDRSWWHPGLKGGSRVVRHR